MSAAAPRRPSSRIDHLVMVADHLDQGVAWCEATLGVTPGPGGRHGLMGTHNRLLALGAPGWPEAYLEIIAIDPAAEAAPAAGRARWFNLDDPGLQAAVRVQPRLVHFVAQTAELHLACAALAAIGEDVGQPVAASRATPQGDLRWQITLRDDGVPQHGGALPALIAWQGTHPSRAMADSGLRLLGMTVQARHPEALRRAWTAIGLQGVDLLEAAGPPLLRARFATPRGEITLVGGAADSSA